MAVFPILKSEDIVQVGDKIRLSAVDTFKTQGEFEISKVEIEPSANFGFIDITDEDQSNWHLDWAYATDGDQVVTLKVTTLDDTDLMAPVNIETEVTKTIVSISAEEDLLFSNDQELKTKEHDILKWIPEGYSSWNHVHRLAQKNILDWLDEIRIFKEDGTRWNAIDIVQKEQVRRISLYMALRMIYSSLQNATDDVFSIKRSEYLAMEREAKNRNHITLDFFGDQVGSRQDLRSMSIVRR